MHARDISSTIELFDVISSYLIYDVDSIELASRKSKRKNTGNLAEHLIK